MESEIKELVIINEIIRKYFTSVDFIKFGKSFDHILINHSNQTSNQFKKRTVSSARLKKYSIYYADKLSQFINENFNKPKNVELLFSIGEELYNAGFSDAALKLLLYAVDVDKYKNLDYIYAKILLTIGSIYLSKELWDKSNKFIKQAERRYTKLKDNSGLVKCYNLLAINQTEIGNIQKGTQLFKKCLLLANETNDSLLQAKIEMNLGVLYLFQYNFRLSLSYSKKALLKFEKFNDFSNIVKLRFNIGNNYLEMNRFTMALNEYDESLHISVKFGYILNIGRVYHNKSLVYLKNNDIEMAIAYWQKALEIYEQTNDITLKYLLIKLRGIIYAKQKKYKIAEKYLIKSKNLLLKYNHSLWIAGNEMELGYLYKDWNKKDYALDCFENALTIFTEMKLNNWIKKVQLEINSIKQLDK